MDQFYRLVAVIIFFILAGCTAHYPVNEPITSIDTSAGYRLGIEMGHPVTAGLHRTWKARTARLATQGLAAQPLGGKALDVAGGTGDLGLALAHLGGIVATLQWAWRCATAYGRSPAE